MTDKPGGKLPEDPLARGPGSRLFLEWESYRRKRAMDAGNIFPVLGVILFLLPVLFASGRDSLPVSGAMIYVFAAWTVLIALSVWLSRLLSQPETQDNNGQDDGQL
ncbi:MAG: hypothetical protein ACPGUX_06710 [Halocynthiibacter sp.]